MAISDANYNRARGILVAAGSRTAAASHEKHTQGTGSPDGHGQQLLREARDEFRRVDANTAPDLNSGMTLAHYNAVHSAAATMGISNW
jgi:hypothetical protein